MSTLILNGPNYSILGNKDSAFGAMRFEAKKDRYRVQGKKKGARRKDYGASGIP
jgi:3-dehydroquinate dehydratase